MALIECILLVFLGISGADPLGGSGWPSQPALDRGAISRPRRSTAGESFAVSDLSQQTGGDKRRILARDTGGKRRGSRRHHRIHRQARNLLRPKNSGRQ